MTLLLVNKERCLGAMLYKGRLKRANREKFLCFFLFKERRMLLLFLRNGGGFAMRGGRGYRGQRLLCLLPPLSL